MTATPPDNLNQPSENDINAEELLRSLRRKEGTWHDWGRACQQLQKAGYNPQQIFEATGFEPIQQNQIVVAAQVYESIDKVGVSTAVQQRFERTGSDSLYELRILNQGDRAAAAELLVEKGIDSEGAREVAKALKDFSRLSTPPAEFANPPGDAVAYHYWRLARQQSDLQMRSRLIAMALRFATSESARRQVEQLLTDFTVTKARKAPSLPVYRLESESELARILPVVGKLPLTVADLQAVPLLEEEGAFRLVKFSGTGAWVPVPGWQIVFSAEDPVVILADRDQLPHPLSGATEEVLVMIDRAQREWDDLSYFVIDNDGELQLQWFAEPPSIPLLGRVLVVLRPKKVLDEDFNKDLWQIEE
ncbi:hypothetical protein H6G89_00680 [Oscillatoria sp. FACHB-1407]|uniref:RuBisCO accumulation factor 1 n=1 Tax=Oscillatoria sp. FACHB-1407 TaxID=2692847 RepID=UPI0016878614|nr:RuBisCO accumulation factor 1 [Oscillatoria sp. FACHB-1407]MBD2459546.1 hypothetical protein [Oscillatoria sp. FACHB-1407]